MPHEPTHSLLAPLAPRNETSDHGMPSHGMPGHGTHGHGVEGNSRAAAQQGGTTPHRDGFAAQPNAASQPSPSGVPQPGVYPGHHAGQPQAMQQPDVQPHVQPQQLAGMARPAEHATVHQQAAAQQHALHGVQQVTAPAVAATQRIVPEPQVAEPSAGGEWANKRDSSLFLRANRHSNRVRLLRIALPVIAVLIIAGIAGAYILSQANLPKVTVATTAFENGRMVMRNPVLDGVDGKQQPYRLTAKQAVQDPKQPKQVELDSISAEVPVQEGVYAHILAGTGFYDGDEKRLDLGGEIEVVTDDGMTAKLQDAAVNIGAGTLKTSNPVAMTTEQAKISAESMFVEDNGARVVFENRVRMTIFPDKIQALQESTSGESSEGNSQ